MRLRFCQEPRLNSPILIAGWAAIGGAGVIAVDTVRLATVADKFAEIDTWGHLSTRSVADMVNDSDVLGNEFFFHRLGYQDLIFFVGQKLPSTKEKVHEMTSLVLDVAEQFQCRRIYTTAAAVSSIHHTTKPKVWIAPNSSALSNEVIDCPCTAIAPKKEAMVNDPRELFGVHGVMMEDARTRGMDLVCLLGEVPNYVARFPSAPYPKASKSIVETLGAILGIEINLDQFDELAKPLEESIDAWVQQLPLEMRYEIDKLKYVPNEKLIGHNTITDEDKESILQDVDRFFRRKE